MHCGFVLKKKGKDEYVETRNAYVCLLPFKVVWLGIDLYLVVWLGIDLFLVAWLGIDLYFFYMEDKWDMRDKQCGFRRGPSGAN